MVINKELLESIYSLKESERVKNGEIGHLEKATNPAESIFLCFQAFLASLIRIDYETITLRRTYESVSHPIRKYLSKINRDYGDLSLVIDDNHGEKIKNVLKKLWEDLGKGRMKLIERPPIISWGECYPSVTQPDTGDNSIRPLIYENLDFHSENGIGGGENYVRCRTTSFLY